MTTRYEDGRRFAYRVSLKFAAEREVWAAKLEALRLAQGVAPMGEWGLAYNTAIDDAVAAARGRP